MRRIDMMTASAVTLTALGALVGYGIGSSGVPSAKLTHGPQPVDVRTEVIRKTVNVYRREHPAHVSAGTGGGASPARGGAHLPATARTRASGAHAASPAAESAVRTRSSGASAPGGSSSPPPVRTRASGSTRPSTGSGAPVRTRSSGAGGSGSSSTGSGRPLRTRSSGGGDDGGGGGHDD